MSAGSKHISSTAVARSTPFDNATNGFTSTEVQSAIEEVKSLVTESRKVKQAFEDFMFDAYAGAGGNDNQYSFLPAANSGSSNIDNVSAVGDDYEGIHILDSLTSAVSRPLLNAFGGVNRIKIGYGQENWEFRVRIETLADNTQKFTTRYGLMDVDTIGMPANGVFFSYDPIYSVTPIAQVVTVTPTGLTQDPTQTFTETLNSTPYSYVYTTPQIINVTPNSFPNATYQVNSITWTRANNTLYQVTINGITISYTSDATATDAEIAAGLVSGINANATLAPLVTAAGTTKPITITSDVLGQAFTISVNANLVLSTTTANVPLAAYTETIAGVPYLFTSDGTPTAAEVVAGLTALINADGACPATASGTTVLTLTGKVSGASWTWAGDSKLTQANATVIPTATQICNGLRSVINADGPLPITGTGTTTLILTADVAGNAFTYSGTANLTQVLTTANVPNVNYQGNWICSVVNGSTVTSVDSGVPIVAGRWDKISTTVNATRTTAWFYVGDILVATINTTIPSVAMRFLFKLEKSLGTSSRTTSVDYIYWNKER